MKYPVNEIFITIQGEGFFSGTPSIFIRLQGCNVGCPWCDTKHTWKLNQSKQCANSDKIFSKEAESNSWAYIDTRDIITYIQTRHSQIKHVVITGGEPALYDLYDLCVALEQNGNQVQIETSATEVLNIPPDTWVTASPKINMPKMKKVLADTIQRANELKMQLEV